MIWLSLLLALAPEITEGPVAKEVFGYLWAPEITAATVYIPDRVAIQSDGQVLIAPFYRPSADAQRFLHRLAVAMRTAYEGHTRGCDVDGFNAAVSAWRFDWDDDKALLALAPCLPEQSAGVGQ